MVSHRIVVGWEFRIFSLVLGVPSLAFLTNLGLDLFVLRSAPPGPPSQPLDIGTYGLVALLVNGARGASMALGFLGQLMHEALVLLAIVMLLATLVALLLFFVARGIDAGETWARILAILISIVSLFAWLGVLSTSRNPFFATACVGIVVALYTLWVLFWRFADR